MSRITSSVGLITGIPIEQTVANLMAIAARPKNLLTERTNQLRSEKAATTQLSSLLLALKFEISQLGKSSLFTATQATSSAPNVLAATVASGGSPAAGNYVFTPVQTAAAQQFLSQSFAADAVVGAGTVTFRIGGFVDRGIALDELNGGAGVRRGSIRITDRSGATAVVDLSYARTVDDVLAAINDNTAVSVSAVADGDALRLIDNSGGSGNLSVQEVAGGSTAADLGLAAINVAASAATGGDVFYLHAGTTLASLNDGTGVQLRSGNDLAVTLRDGTTVEIELGNAATLGGALQAMNSASPSKLSAAIAADGNRLVLTDLTSGAGTFAVANVGSGTAATDLGLTAAAVDDTITGQRLVSGLRDTLISSLRGGQGFGTLGDIDITNRNGASSTVDLAGAETLGQIIAAINAQAVGVMASVNTARNGIVLTDTTGATVGNLIVADGDSNNSATALGIVANVAATKVDSGALNRRTVSAATPLASLNGGTGVAPNDFKIVDSAGNVGAVDLNPTGNVAATLGDVIDRINALSGVGVSARINESGDGILLIDTAGGGGKLRVEEVGNTTTARDLRILGTAIETQIDGQPVQAINGTAVVTVVIGENDTLADVVQSVNSLSRGVTASLINDGTGRRLLLGVDRTGDTNAVLLDTSDSTLAMEAVRAARDALVVYGATGTGGGVLIRSSTNNFENVVDGLNLTVLAATREPVTVGVGVNQAAIIDAAGEFVDAYNSLRNALNELTEFDAEGLTTGILFGTRQALRVEQDLAYALTRRYFGAGKFQSLDAVGISLTPDGKMELNHDKLSAAFAADPAGFEEFFTNETNGVAARLDQVIDDLAGASGSLLSLREATLKEAIESNTERIETMDGRLARERERLLAQFALLESTIAALQKNLTALSSLQVLPPLTVQRQTR